MSDDIIIITPYDIIPVLLAFPFSNAPHGLING